MKSQFSLLDHTGRRSEVEISLADYKAAGERGLSLSQHLAQRFPTTEDSGTPLEQFMEQAGMFIKGDRKTGLRSPVMKQVLDGDLRLNMGSIVGNDGSGTGTPSGRLLFPEVVLQLIQSELTEDDSDFLGGYNSMIAVTETVTSARFEQPVVDVTAPRDIRAQPIAQLAEPASMVSITVSDKVRRIPTVGIGLQFSDQALENTTLDLVGTIVQQQAAAERVALVEEQLNGMIAGDVDTGDGQLTSFAASTLSTGLAAGALDQKAWIKYLRQNYRRMSVSHIITDIDTALIIEGRTGKPTVTGDDPTSSRIDSLFSLENLGIKQAPRVLLVDFANFPGINAANYPIIGLDKRYAIRRVVNVSASYTAIEQWVMRRAQALRFDYGEIAHRLMDQGWTYMTLT